jgi:hypothetical protein
MIDRITTTLRAVFTTWERYQGLQFNAPVQLFHDGR